MSMKSRRPNDQAREALLNTQLVVTELAVALSTLDVSLAGWPEQTPGAAPADPRGAQPCRNDDCTHIRPCPVHDDDPVKLTGPERNADQFDEARRDLGALLEHVRLLAHHARAAAVVTHRWAQTGVTKSTVADTLAAIDAEIWCSHCVQFGEHNPREEGRTLCRFCRSFKVDWKLLPSREIWSARNARGGRLDVATIMRLTGITKPPKQAATAVDAGAAGDARRKRLQGA